MSFVNTTHHCPGFCLHKPAELKDSKIKALKHAVIFSLFTF